MDMEERGDGSGVRRKVGVMATIERYCMRNKKNKYKLIKLIKIVFMILKLNIII